MGESAESWAAVNRKNLWGRLFELEVPEIHDGLILKAGKRRLQLKPHFVITIIINLERIMIVENTTKDQNEKYMLQSVTNALRIIELLGEHNFLTLTEIADGLDLGKSSVFRLVATLEARGFVKKDKYGRCRLGMKFSYFGSVVLARMEILQASRPYLEELQRNVHETVHLAIWDDDWNIRFIDKIDGGIEMCIRDSLYTGRLHLKRNFLPTGQSRFPDSSL